MPRPAIVRSVPQGMGTAGHSARVCVGSPTAPATGLTSARPAVGRGSALKIVGVPPMGKTIAHRTLVDKTLKDKTLVDRTLANMQQIQGLGGYAPGQAAAEGSPAVSPRPRLCPWRPRWSCLRYARQSRNGGWALLPRWGREGSPPGRRGSAAPLARSRPAGAAWARVRAMAGVRARARDGASTSSAPHGHHCTRARRRGSPRQLRFTRTAAGHARAPHRLTSHPSHRHTRRPPVLPQRSPPLPHHLPPPLQEEEGGHADDLQGAAPSDGRPCRLQFAYYTFIKLTLSAGGKKCRINSQCPKLSSRFCALVHPPG